MLISIILLIFIYSNIIIEINIETSNKYYYNIISNELAKYKLNKYTIKKSEKKLNEIKNKILDNNKSIEWLNIENVGMKYNIKLEPNISYEIEEKHSKCDIVSTKDATITKVISSNGVELKEINDYVKKDDVLITGEIKLQDETKNYICAEGTVYGKTWYTIKIKTTKYYENKTNTKKKRYNIEFNNKKLFKDKYLYHDDTKKRLIKIFNNEINIIKEQEVNKEYLKYDEDTLYKRIDKLIEEKMNSQLKDNYKIIERKLLKKVDNNSTIELEYFIVAEEIISTKKIIE